jgi:tetratricopeptide (TPR) repeat protein
MQRGAQISASVVLLLAAAAAGWWWLRSPSGPTPDGERASEVGPPSNERLPVPPMPPRVAEGEDYEHCLSMLNTDPAGANAFAENWAQEGGNDGAAHCHALAQIALGNVATGAELMEALGRSSTQPGIARASVFGQAGQAWMMTGQADRAYAAATLALALSPDDADLLIDRAVAAASLGRYAEAIDDLDHALDVDPRRPDALVYRGSAWRHEGHLELAQDDIDRALAVDPDDSDALLERGILCQRRGDREGARANWERAIALDPGSTTADLAEQDLALLEAGPEQR